MPENTEELTPSQIVAELDKYIVGQKNAKRAVAVALRNRYRRRLLPEDLRDEVIPKNILMIGPTGVGKTEIARRLAQLAHAPFVKVEATKFTEVGYVGRDVDSMIRDLLQVALRLVEQERLVEVEDAANERAVDRIIEILQPTPTSSKRRSAKPDDEQQDLAQAIRQMMGPLLGNSAAESTPEPPASTPVENDEEKQEASRTERIRARLRQQIESGLRDEEEISITVEEQQSNTPFMQIFPGQGMDDMDMSGPLSNLIPRKRKQRRVTIAEAKRVFSAEEAQNLLDKDAITRDAINRTEQTGIIFVDEIDKVAGSTGRSGGPDVSREGVQRDILPIIEGSTVNTRHGPVRTDHILFIAAGAFHIARPSDLIPELQGRLPIRVELESLTQEDFERILTEPRNALTRQYKELLGTEGMKLEFTPDAVSEIAKLAAEVNRTTENIGARRLHTILERLLEDLSFSAPELSEREICIDAAYVTEHLADIVKNEDLSKYIL